MIAVCLATENEGQNGSLVLATFGPFVVVDTGRYPNEQPEEWHREKAEAYAEAVKGGAL